ncbi:MAG TPA: cyclic nucleotide-binding domain-containing protein, partial [Rhizobiales bacterium]|nr:cyclic nucleotide-binding domain-containing protein [Hyphomicrobiales bacterium]
MKDNPTSWQIYRRRAHELLEQGGTEDIASRSVDFFIIGLVIANIIAFMFSTVPEIEAQWGLTFERFEVFSVAVFTLEYIARIWASAEFPFSSKEPVWKTRLKFALRPLQVIDLLVILPFYLSFLFAMDLRVLRILRLFRLLKLARYSPAMQSLVAVISNERRALFGALLLMVCLLLFASTGIYFLEHKAQPDAFGSVPAALWWAVATLTTVGYGDVTPITPWGKIFGGLVMVFGLGMFALPIGIMATGFSQETHRREFVVSWNLVANVPMFAQLDGAEIARLLPVLNSATFEPGQLIVHEGDLAKAMYFIASGKVEVETAHGLVPLSEGDHFGEMALLEKRQRSHTVRALTKCRLLILEAPDFHRLMRGRPELLEIIAQTAR